VAITPVSSIPLPPRGGFQNPVAHDTESEVPKPPPKAKEAERRQPDEKAIEIKSRRDKKRQADLASSRSTYRPDRPDRPNQIYSNAGQAVSSPMYGSTTGSGNIGVGTGSPFGVRFGYYEQLIREKVARLWRTGDVDPTLRTAPTVVVTFDIVRDGSIRNVKILQRSGNYALDTSAQRAVTEAAPFPQLPQGYERDSARIEFWFNLKR
jgi:TonB family protein